MNTPEPLSEPTLKVENLEVTYGPVTAAKDVSLLVGRGEIIALLGPNGAGKTSVLKAILGLARASSGTIEFSSGGNTRRIDRVPTHQLAKLGIASVPALSPILPRMTVAENLEVGSLFLSASARAVSEARERLYDRFPILRERRRQFAGSLSGGEQRMLAIARSLMPQPRLLLLDEPSLGLAPIPLAKIFGLLVEINRSDGVDILIVEQNVKKALEVSHRAYVMRIGGIEFSGPSREIAESGRLHDAYLGS